MKVYSIDTNITKIHRPNEYNILDKTKEIIESLQKIKANRPFLVENILKRKAQIRLRRFHSQKIEDPTQKFKVKQILEWFNKVNKHLDEISGEVAGRAIYNRNVKLRKIQKDIDNIKNSNSNPSGNCGGSTAQNITDKKNNIIKIGQKYRQQKDRTSQQIHRMQNRMKQAPDRDLNKLETKWRGKEWYRDYRRAFLNK